MEKMVEVERATQEELRQDLKSLFQGAIRVTLEMVLEEELKAMVGARRFERVSSRKDHRNGTYLRRLLTSLGQIDVMGRYRRRSEEVDEMMVEAYVSGVSQRKMALQAAIAGLAASSCPSDAGSLPRSPPPASAGPPGSGLRSVPVLAAPRRSSGPRTSRRCVCESPRSPRSGPRSRALDATACAGATPSTRWGRDPAAGTSCAPGRRPGDRSRARIPSGDRSALPCEPGRGFCQDIPFQLHPAKLTLQLPHFLALGRRQAVVAQALVPVRLLHPAPDRRRRRLELLRQPVRAAARPDQLHHPRLELRRVPASAPCHGDTSPLKSNA